MIRSVYTLSRILPVYQLKGKKFGCNLDYKLTLYKKNKTNFVCESKQTKLISENYFGKIIIKAKYILLKGFHNFTKENSYFTSKNELDDDNNTVIKLPRYKSDKNLIAQKNFEILRYEIDFVMDDHYICK